MPVKSRSDKFDKFHEGSSVSCAVLPTERGQMICISNGEKIFIITQGKPTRNGSGKVGRRLIEY
jgi:hypothetical protein